MSDPEEIRKQQKIDQGSALISESWPPLWWRLYENLQTEGFEERQAMELLKTWINAIAGGKLCQ